MKIILRIMSLCLIILPKGEKIYEIDKILDLRFETLDLEL